MSYNTFPTLQGLGWDIKKRPIWSTAVEVSSSGAEYRTGRFSQPIYEFDLQFTYLTQADFNTLVAFFNQQQGALTPFYLQPTNDSTATGVAFATTDGTTTSWQLLMPDGAQTQAIIGTPTIYGNGIAMNPSGTGTPGAPVLGQVAGGTKAARTYYVRTAFYDPLVNFSAASVEASLAVSANNLLTVQAPAMAGDAVGWAVYIGTSSGSETLAYYGPAASYTEPTGSIPSLGAFSTTDHTPFSVSASGLLTLQGPGQSGNNLTWSGSYAYLVRFKDDQIETNQIMNQIYEQTGITFRSVR